MIRAVRPPRKHLALLVVLVGMLLVQPLSGHRGVAVGAFFDAVVAGIAIYLPLIVFEERWERHVAVILVSIVIASNAAIYVLPRGGRLISEAVFHSAMATFLSFAIAVILHGIFRKSMIRFDDVVGAFCGYLLLGLVWANLYTLIYLILPGAFAVNPQVAWRLGHWHQRRALFEYLSFTTLMTLGYGDITPIGPPVYTLTWLEVMVGQFYMAVVVAQLVGLKLAQALTEKGQDRK